MEPMKPMAPLKPMEPMKSFSFGDPWWPAGLGQPSSVGSQNGVRYAFFPESRRLLIDRDGDIRTYDSADHRINGVSQQSSRGSGLAFSSQHGPVALESLRRVDASDSDGADEGEPASPASETRESNDPAPTVPSDRLRDEAERVVFTEESGSGRYIKVVAKGDIDEHALASLEDFVTRSRKRRTAA